MGARDKDQTVPFSIPLSLTPSFSGLVFLEMNLQSPAATAELGNLKISLPYTSFRLPLFLLQNPLPQFLDKLPEIIRTGFSVPYFWAVFGPAHAFAIPLSVHPVFHRTPEVSPNPQEPLSNTLHLPLNPLGPTARK